MCIYVCIFLNTNINLDIHINYLYTTVIVCVRFSADSPGISPRRSGEPRCGAKAFALATPRQDGAPGNGAAGVLEPLIYGD